ncbi:MAG: hypothetical protein A2Y17_12715 [Clostridiales bacterium GWF2_38_85]|nr:MAG: hypothetical protein A2Y17_12715 [Clostridiales bacterium GWF2_38_85]HBL84121.1 molybdopterin oxidoreductase [Clostridiales bacterium]
MTERKMTCIICPRGCRMTVKYENNTLIECKDNFCARGPTYAKNEIAAPTRVLTSTIPTDSKTVPLMPVKTSKAIPKEQLFTAMKLVKTIRAKAPLKCGDVIYKDFMVQGTDLICGRNLKV